MILEDALAAAGDENELLDPGGARSSNVLDERPVDHRQHLLGQGLGGRQHAGAQPGDGKYGLADHSSPLDRGLMVGSPLGARALAPGRRARRGIAARRLTFQQARRRDGQCRSVGPDNAPGAQSIPQPLASTAEQEVLRLIELGGEIAGSAVVGVQLGHQPSVRCLDLVCAGTWPWPRIDHAVASSIAPAALAWPGRAPARRRRGRASRAGGPDRSRAEPRAGIVALAVGQELEQVGEAQRASERPANGRAGPRRPARPCVVELHAQAVGDHFELCWPRARLPNSSPPAASAAWRAPP